MRAQRLLKETELRAAELAIINSVQEGLAAKMEIQSIYDLVGEKIRETFRADTAYIAVLDEPRNVFDFPYYVDSGQRLASVGLPVGRGLTSEVFSGRAPLLLNTTAEMAKHDPVTDAYEDASRDPNQSFLGVPVLLGERVSGVVSVQSHQANAYSENDMRLLQTLANSMSVALESARLFDETQRLLKETEQRAAELAIINSVQEGLASEMEMQSIYDLVGNKIHETFPEAQEVGIITYDRSTDLFHPRFVLERRQRYDIEAWTPVGFRRHVLDTRRTMAINRDAERLAAEFRNPLVSGERAKSFLFVPLTVGDEVIGIVELQHIDREDAFSESDVRLRGPDPGLKRSLGR